MVSTNRVVKAQLKQIAPQVAPKKEAYVPPKQISTVSKVHGLTSQRLAVASGAQTVSNARTVKMTFGRS